MTHPDRDGDRHEQSGAKAEALGPAEPNPKRKASSASAMDKAKFTKPK
jgi:hypothetical protein